MLQPRPIDCAISNQDWATLGRTAEILGATVGSMQVWDSIRVIQFMARGLKIDPAPISICGKENMGILALYAAIMDSPSSATIRHQHIGTASAAERSWSG